jgi:hypothetical protein
MAKIRRFIPFGMWPSSWGLTGSRRKRAYCEYHYDGEDLAYKLLEVDYSDPRDQETNEYKLEKVKLDYKYRYVTEYEHEYGLIAHRPDMLEVDRQRELAKIDHRFGKISAEDLEYKMLELSYPRPEGESYQRERLKLDQRFGRKTEEEVEHELLDLTYATNLDSIDYKVAKLKLDFKYGKLTETKYEKETATLLREPWFDIIGAEPSIRGENVSMAIELDWNVFFVDFLRSKGWVGATEDEIVDRWFEEAMRQMLDIDADGESVDDGSEDPMPTVNSHIRKKTGDDGLTEYS